MLTELYSTPPDTPVSIRFRSTARDDGLPSYGDATTSDHWSIIASFLRSKDLCAAALVSRIWNQTFMPQLWGNPASHFGKEFDAVYTALVRFKRTLSWARFATRELTHTLHLPPAQAELYDGPRSEWLQDILERLPRLQSLIVAQLPFFDHGALVHLGIPKTPGVPPMYNLRLLDASGCFNTTTQGIEIALKHLPALLYLDISGTVAGRSPQVLSNLWRNPALQILKARGLALTDNDIHILAHAVGKNLRSLDVRDNRLTDLAVDTLIEKCIKPFQRFRQKQSASNFPYGSWTLNQPISENILEVFQNERQDDYIRNNLTTGFVNYLGLERTSGSGLTHILISGNEMTVAGIAKLLRTKKLHVLDAGKLLRSMSNIPEAQALIPGTERLTPVLAEFAEGLTYLRVNHALITKDAPDAWKMKPELDEASTIVHPIGLVELDTNEQAVYEMSANEIHELPANLPSELEGSSPTLSPSIDVRLDTDLKRPVAVHTTSSTAPIPTSTLFSPRSDKSGRLLSPISPVISGSTTPTMDHNLVVPTVGLHQRTYSGVLNDHEAQKRKRLSKPHSLLPYMTPNLQTLVLTDVPPKSHSPETARHIIQFISDCATEAHWAKLSSKVGYALPPGPDRRSAERQYATSLFPLRRIVLEMAEERVEAPTMAGWRKQTQSSVLDPDCENFWNAAKDDFSFFGGEECGVPDADPSAHIPLATLTEKMTVVADDHASSSRQAYAHAPRAKPFDVLAEVSRFRREKKTEYDAAVADGDSHAIVEGYWEGQITIVRPGR